VLAHDRGRSVVQPLRDLVARTDASLPLDDVRSMADVVHAATTRQRYTMVLVLVTAAAALFLATVGLYGLLAHMVADRRREMGLRIALGAPAGSIRSLVLRRALGLTGVGVLLGSALSLASSRVAESVLFGVPAIDPLTMVGVATLVSGVAWVAARIPAGRACAVAPATTLRGD
jgi:ABC-type antimicrobial peptide transport system permease subunit